jgi:hypothetical protein
MSRTLATRSRRPLSPAAGPPVNTLSPVARSGETDPSHTPGALALARGAASPANADAPVRNSQVGVPEAGTTTPHDGGSPRLSYWSRLQDGIRGCRRARWARSTSTAT